jgi:hypothetical protein
MRNPGTKSKIALPENERQISRSLRRPMNHLYYGDNLYVLRESIATESVDLIYLDPPFNSKRDYNLLFKSPKGAESQAQIEAFEDTWHWNQQAEREFDELMHQSNTDVSEMMKALRSFFRDLDRKEPRKIIVSVKSGHLKADDVRALGTVREQQGAEIALLVTLDEPTKGMISDAAAEGFYTGPSGKKYPRIQILTIADLLDGKARAEHPDYEPDLNFKKAKTEASSSQADLL